MPPKKAINKPTIQSPKLLEKTSTSNTMTGQDDLPVGQDMIDADAMTSVVKTEVDSPSSQKGKSKKRGSENVVGSAGPPAKKIKDTSTSLKIKEEDEDGDIPMSESVENGRPAVGNESTGSSVLKQENASQVMTNSDSAKPPKVSIDSCMVYLMNPRLAYFLLGDENDPFQIPDEIDNEDDYSETSWDAVETELPDNFGEIFNQDRTITVYELDNVTEVEAVAQRIKRDQEWTLLKIKNTQNWENMLSRMLARGLSDLDNPDDRIRGICKMDGGGRGIFQSIPADEKETAIEKEFEYMGRGLWRNIKLWKIYQRGTLYYPGEGYGSVSIETARAIRTLYKKVLAEHAGDDVEDEMTDSDHSEEWNYEPLVAVADM